MIAARRAVAVLAAVLAVPTAAAVAQPAPTPPPTAGQVLRTKQQADAHAATLRQRIAAGEQRMAALTRAAQEADAAFDRQLRVTAGAKVAESLATGALQRAQATFASARAAMVQLAVAAYENGGTTPADLFAAADPEQLLEAAAYQQLGRDYQAQLTRQLHQAVLAQQQAEARQRQALAQVGAQLDALGELRARAEQARGQAAATLAALRTDMRAAQRGQAAADRALSAYLVGWVKVDPGQSSALNQRFQAIAQDVAGRNLPKNTGHWSAAIGQAAADRAIQWIGTPYAWAGGDGSGPTRGTCTGDGAENDCRVVGFDCSGLVMYAWGPYRTLAHFAATQYTQAGRLHPEPDKLLPGDLLFWSSDGTVRGIHHVAVYLGDGYVVQAPESGDIVRVTPVGAVSDGFYGATRPLT